jgi:hypothetical protein
MPLLWLLKFLFKMKDNTFSIFAKKASTILDNWCVWRATGIFSVFFAAERAFHSYPHRNHDVLRVNPLEILQAML